MRKPKVSNIGRAIVGVCIFLIAPAIFAQESDPCLNLQSQSEMNSCEAEQYSQRRMPS